MKQHLFKQFMIVLILRIALLHLFKKNEYFNTHKGQISQVCSQHKYSICRINALQELRRNTLLININVIKINRLGRLSITINLTFQQFVVLLSKHKPLFVVTIQKQICLLKQLQRKLISSLLLNKTIILSVYYTYLMHMLC